MHGRSCKLYNVLGFITHDGQPNLSLGQHRSFACCPGNGYRKCAIWLVAVAERRKTPAGRPVAAARSAAGLYLPSCAWKPNAGYLNLHQQFYWADPSKLTGAAGVLHGVRETKGSLIPRIFPAASPDLQVLPFWHRWIMAEAGDRIWPQVPLRAQS